MNLAIQRGNPYIIKTFLDKGNPSPFVKDSTGKSPIHHAACKLDRDTFERLIELGFDPLIPDADGNTFLHMIVNQSIKEKEYEFIRDVVSKYRLRLTRNNEGASPMEIIKKSAGQSAGLRGQPNFRRKIWEFFEQYLSQEPTFIDSADKNSELGDWIHQKNLFKIKEIIEAKIEDVHMNSE